MGVYSMIENTNQLKGKQHQPNYYYKKVYLGSNNFPEFSLKVN